jgi:prepilin-type N-terminal cleavage/methylation domain-containing protein
MRTRRRTDAGFTLTELMVVVVILGVLAAIAIPAYKKYVQRSRRAEVPGMIGKIQVAQEAYRTENGVYVSTGAGHNAVFPAVASLSDRLTATPVLPTTWAGAGSLRISPNGAGLYCGYVSLAGEPGIAPTDADALAIFGGAAPQRQWFYVHALCNWNPDATNEDWLVRDDWAPDRAYIRNTLR